MRLRRPAVTLMLVAAIGADIAIGAGQARASGGGCGGPVTDRSGTTVAIGAFCFSPTILRVEPGQTVTFDNRDPWAHVVPGANGIWGSYDLVKRRHDVTYTFSEPGVYPYVCTLHPGMVGAIVVGNGIGVSFGATTADGPVAPARGSGLEAARSTEGAGRSAAVAAAALLIPVSVAAFVVRRRRRRGAD